MNKYSKILDAVMEVLKWICGICLCIVFLFSFINIVTRNIFLVSWLFIPGIIKTAFLWMVFCGIAVLYRLSGHLKMDFFSDKFSKKTGRIFEMIFILLEIILFVIFVIFGLKISNVRMHINFDTWRFPTGYAFLALPVNSFIMLFFTFEKILKIKEKK